MSSCFHSVSFWLKRTNKHRKKMAQKCKCEREKKRKQRPKAKMTAVLQIDETESKQTELQNRVVSATKSFDRTCESICHEHCPECKSVSLFLPLRESGFCSVCLRDARFDSATQSRLSTWTDTEGNQHCELPNELHNLTDEEKLSIQKMFTHVPLQVLNCD